MRRVKNGAWGSVLSVVCTLLVGSCFSTPVNAQGTGRIVGVLPACNGFVAITESGDMFSGSSSGCGVLTQQSFFGNISSGAATSRIVDFVPVCGGYVAITEAGEIYYAESTGCGQLRQFSHLGNIFGATSSAKIAKLMSYCGGFVATTEAGDMYYASATNCAPLSQWSFLGNIHSGISATPAPAAEMHDMRVVPNPATGAASLVFSTSRAGEVEAGIYDVAGRLIRKLSGNWATIGEHAIAWDGRDEHGESVGAGVYVYTVRIDNRPNGSRTFVLVR